MRRILLTAVFILCGSVGADEIQREVLCFGGDALDSADLSAVTNAKEDVVELSVETGAADNEKDELKRNFTAHLAKGAYRQMIQKGRIEIVMQSEKSGEFGGETTYAALVDLVKDGKGGFKGHIALDGSVYDIFCPKEPLK